MSSVVEKLEVEVVCLVVKEDLVGPVVPSLLLCISGQLVMERPR